MFVCGISVYFSLSVNTYIASFSSLQVGVEIYVDAVINHMAAGSGTVMPNQIQTTETVSTNCKLFGFTLIFPHLNTSGILLTLTENRREIWH